MKRDLDQTGNFFHSLSDPRTIALAAMLIALNVVLSRFLSIQTQFLRIGFGFLPVAILSLLYGPIAAGMGAALGDLIGFFLFPGGPYFLGFTVSAFLSGLLYGLFLYKEKLSLLRISIACLAVGIVVDLYMNTQWLVILYGQALSAIIIPRLIKTAVSVPVQIILIFIGTRIMKKRIQKFVQD